MVIYTSHPPYFTGKILLSGRHNFVTTYLISIGIIFIFDEVHIKEVATRLENSSCHLTYLTYNRIIDDPPNSLAASLLKQRQCGRNNPIQ